MSQQQLQEYATLIGRVFQWAMPGNPFGPHTSIRAYMTRVPRRGNITDDVDREFWAGEVIDEIRAEASRTLTRSELAELDREVDVLRSGWDASIRASRSSRAVRKNPAPPKVVRRGDRVTITSPEDDTEIMHDGVVTKVDGEWITVRIDGEHTVSEWPIDRVWPYTKNCGGSLELGGGLDQAKEIYEAFHRYPPKKIGEFGSRFSIPGELRVGGKGVYVAYRSGKVDPSTLKKPSRPVNYIHHFNAGVNVYLPVDEQGFEDRKVIEVPAEFRAPDALALLGLNLGYQFLHDGDEITAEEAIAGAPELYCSPNGKCLYVIERKRTVVAMMWGGALGVFPRGIDG